MTSSLGQHHGKEISLSEMERGGRTMLMIGRRRLLWHAERFGEDLSDGIVSWLWILESEAVGGV